MIITKPIGSPNHSIRQPVETLGYDNTRNHEQDRLNFLLSGPPSFKFGSYSSTIRDAANATTTARAFQTFSMAAQTTFGTQLGTSLPWSPDWIPTDTSDNDRMVTIVNHNTGRTHNCWMVDRYNLGAFWHLPNHTAAFDIQNPNHLAMATMTNPEQSIFTMEDWQSGGAVGTHGAKIHALLGVILAHEVHNGWIPHAISVSVSNPAYGTLTNGKLVETVPARLCGPIQLEHRNPATLGLGGVTPTPHPLNTCLPSGHRLATTITDTSLNELIAKHFPNPGQLRRTARTFATACRTHGIIVLETNGYGLGIQTEGWNDPHTKRVWARCGVRTTKDVTRLDTFTQDLLANHPWKTVNERNIEQPKIHQTTVSS